MIPGKHDQLGIANKTRRQPITTTLGKLYVVALFISPPPIKDMYFSYKPFILYASR